jgi:hypothetical protein
MDMIASLFKQHCGPDVSLTSSERVFREIKISYTIPLYNPERVFYIRVTPENGLHGSTRKAVLRAADAALGHAYRMTGKRAADMRQLQEGKLVDEHSRSVS